MIIREETYIVDEPIPIGGIVSIIDGKVVRYRTDAPSGVVSDLQGSTVRVQRSGYCFALINRRLDIAQLYGSLTDAQKYNGIGRLAIGSNNNGLAPNADWGLDMFPVCASDVPGTMEQRIVVNNYPFGGVITMITLDAHGRTMAYIDVAMLMQLSGSVARNAVSDTFDNYSLIDNIPIIDASSTAEIAQIMSQPNDGTFGIILNEITPFVGLPE